MIKEVGATLILLCDSPLAPVAKYADYLFTTSTESISFFNSEVGITAIYEYFVTLIFDTMPEEWRQQVKDRWELDDRFFNEYRL